MKKKEYDIWKDPPSRDWTVKDLKTFIKERTRTANERIYSYKELNLHDKVYEHMLHKLEPYAGKKGTLIQGFRGKTKSQLVMQAKKLEAFKRVDVITPQAVQEEKDRVFDAYEKFTYNYGLDMSLETYEKLVDAFGTIGDEIMGRFDYMAFVDEYVQTIKAGKEVNIVKIVEEEFRLHKGIDMLQRTTNIVNRIRDEAGFS